jgi:hypothetical protein
MGDNFTLLRDIMKNRVPLVIEVISTNWRNDYAQNRWCNMRRWALPFGFAIAGTRENATPLNGGNFSTGVAPLPQRCLTNYWIGKFFLDLS